MNFVVSTATLLKQLQVVIGAIPSNPPMLILENLLFNLNNNQLHITATDLENSVSTYLDVETTTEDEQKITIPARLLNDTLKNLPDQPLHFECNTETGSIEIKSLTGRYRLTGEPAENFPPIKPTQSTQQIELPANVLASTIAKTIFAAGTDDLRPAMTGLYFDLSPNEITFVATDAHKLVKIIHTNLPNATAEIQKGFIVPRKAINLLKTALPANTDTPVTITYNDRNAQFNFNNTAIICRLIDANYPNYNAVIPTQNTNELRINRNDLLSALKRLSIYSNKSTYQVSLKITADSLNILAQDLDYSNEANETLLCEYNGDNMDIGFNARFLIDILNALDNEEVTLQMATPQSAALILPTEQLPNQNLLMLIMPIRLGY